MKKILILLILTLLIAGCSISKSSDLTLNNQLNNQTTSTNDISGNKDATSTPILSYADVVNKNSLFDKSEVDGSVKTSYVGKKIQWQAKIASSLTQRDGIKFCIIDDKRKTIPGVVSWMLEEEADDWLMKNIEIYGKAIDEINPLKILADKI